MNQAPRYNGIRNCTITRQRADAPDLTTDQAHVDFPRTPAEPIAASGQIERRVLKVPVGTDIKHADTILFVDPPDPIAYRVVGVQDRARNLIPRLIFSLEGRRA